MITVISAPTAPNLTSSPNKPYCRRIGGNCNSMLGTIAAIAIAYRFGKMLDTLNFYRTRIS